ncbi:MAG TPA: glycosyltransferase [Candidatus Saccharimonadales bacterium]|nr:glycosyltransferase [Candidatus Saccharimonadales bacterium]
MAILTVAQRVTIVLLTYNCEDHILDTVHRLAALNIPIIAVDNASTDNTVSLLQRFSQVEVLSLTKNIGAAARNVGVQHATTPYIAFCDDDTAWEIDGLQKAADMFDVYPRLGLITGRILVGQQQRLDAISEQMADSPLPNDVHIPGSVLLSFMGGASIARKTAWQDVGGYERRFFIGGEEEHTAWQLAKKGWEMRYVPEVVVHHYPSNNNADNIRHYGIRNTLWTAWLHRPLRSALAWTWHIIRSTPKNRILLQGLIMTIPGIPWVLAHRQPFTPELEHKIQLLEQQRQKGGHKRTYGIDMKSKRSHEPTS